MNSPLWFPPDSGLRRQLQPSAARRHPGKLDLNFLAYLATAESLTEQTLLDPMAGSGSILYLTLAPWGCSVVANELEPAWADLLAATWAHLQGRGFDTPTGAATLLCGDARTLPARLGVDAILTSPPYQDALSSIRHQSGIERELTHGTPGKSAAGRQALRGGYGAILTSPPYADALSGTRHKVETYQGPKDGPGSAASRHALRQGYVPAERNPAQIGNLAGARYAAAMAEVYGACVPLLRPGGRCIVVLKNVVRKGREVDLIGQAQGQLEALGLRYVRTHWRAVRLGAFHAIRRKQNPDALIVDREAALVMQKPGAV